MAKTKEMITVVLIDNRRGFRNELRQLLERSDDFSVIGIFSDCESARAALPNLPSDLLLFSPAAAATALLPQMRTIALDFPHLRLLPLLDRPDDRLLVELLRLGVVGILPRTTFPADVVRALREFSGGGVPLGREAAKQLLALFRPNKHELSDLSARERSVFQLLCRGKNYQEIAEALYVSTNTVRFHLKNIYRKLGVKSRHEAMARNFRVAG